VKLAAHGISVELPAGWSGRVFSRQDGAATAHAANFPIALSDGEFGDQSTRAMHAGASFIALAEYRPGDGLTPGAGLFSPRRIPRPLDPAGFSVRGLQHPRPGQVGSQHFFTAAGRPFCLYVVLAGGRPERRRQLAVVDHVLGSLRVDPRGVRS
jgi:hypothetical protein